MRKPAFSYVKTKAQKFQASSHFLWLYSPKSVGGPGRKPRRHVFSCRGSCVMRLVIRRRRNGQGV